MKKGTRILALLLTLACVVGVVAVAAADGINLNLNGDKNSKGEDIVNLWDAQEALYGTKIEETDRKAYLQAINGKILGQVSPIDNTYYVFTAEDLKILQTETTADYVLMDDIDLNGDDWTPVADFSGEFDGNGKTISNFAVTKSVGEDIGFFADSLTTANIHDLHLADYTVTVADDSTVQYVGGLVGTTRGIIRNCTVDGRMVDHREKTSDSKTIYRGILTGRATGASAAITLGSMDTYAYEGEVRRDDADCSVAAAMAFDLPEDTTPSQYGNWFVGIVGGTGCTYKPGSETAVWRDNSNSTEYDDATLVEKRQKAVDYMYQMGSVKWSPSELLFYIKQDSDGEYSGRYFSPDYTYTGIPYTGGMSDLERALSVMEADQNGVYILDDSMTDGFDDRKTLYATYGFSRYLGSDCSSAMLLAWQKASHSRVFTAEDDGTAQIPDGCYNGIQACRTNLMVPTQYNYIYYGVLPVGYEQAETTGSTTVEIIQSMTEEANDTKPAEADYAAMAEYYAMAKKGDGMLYRQSSGHARLIACDPVVIRDASGVIDQHRSYMITHEQGDGMYSPEAQAVAEKITYKDTLPDGTELEKEVGTRLTSWRTNHEYTFEELLKGTYNNGTENARDKSTGMTTYGGGYLPITISAYSFTGTDTYYIDAKYTERENSPIIYSYYRVLSATLIIQDSAGEEVYRLKRYNDVDYGLAYTKGDRDTDAGKTVELNKLFADYDELLMEKTGMSWEEMITAGYTYTFEMELSSGRTAKMTDTGSAAWRNTSSLAGTLEAFGQLPKEATE